MVQLFTRVGEFLLMICIFASAILSSVVTRTDSTLLSPIFIIF